MKSRKLDKDKLKDICICGSGEEEFCNGIFKFNISELLEGMDENRVTYALAKVSLKELKLLAISAEELEPEHIDAADTARPVILLEIAPDYKDFIPDIPEDNYLMRGYVLADGNHRVAKADKLGLNHLHACVIRMEDHIKYMYDGYEKYAEYWNGKLKERQKDSEG